MLNKTGIVQFQKIGHDSFIDFLKAYCILVVVFCHGFPFLNAVGYPIWGAEIPIFFIIQVFHCYKRPPKPVNWETIVKRILVPFFLIEIVLFGFYYIKGSDYDFSIALISGGIGPGSYYPWVYIQMAIIIPLFRSIFERLGKWKSLLIFIVLSEAIELFCSLIHLPDTIYRLLCLRYIPLIWFGWVWVHEGIKINFVNTILAIIGLLSIIYLVYFGKINEPWMYNTSWLTHRMPCYLWVGFALVGILYLFYKLFSKCKIIIDMVAIISSSSYEIFIIQMAYYSLISQNVFDFIVEPRIRFLIWFCMAFIVSISGGILLYKTEKKYL